MPRKASATEASVAVDAGARQPRLDPASVDGERCATPQREGSLGTSVATADARLCREPHLDSGIAADGVRKKPRKLFSSGASVATDVGARGIVAPKPVEPNKSAGESAATSAGTDDDDNSREAGTTMSEVIRSAYACENVDIDRIYLEEVLRSDASVASLSTPLAANLHRASKVPTSRTAEVAPSKAPLPLLLTDWFAIFLGCIVPSVAAVVGFSLPFFGTNTFSFVASAEANIPNTVLSALVIAWFVVLFIGDAHRAPTSAKLAFATNTFVLLASVALLKSIDHPWAIVLLTVSVGPVCVCSLRRARRSVGRLRFYLVVAAVAWLLVFATLGFWISWTILSDYTESSAARWTRETKQQLVLDTSAIYRHVYSVRPLDYEGDCASNSTEAEGSKEQGEIAAACLKVDTVQLLVWASPVAVVALYAVVGVFCLLQARLKLESTRDVTRLARETILLIVFFAVGMHSSVTYVAGSSPELLKAFLVFSCIACFGLLAFIRFEVPQVVLIAYCEKSLLIKYSIKGYSSDLVRAVATPVWALVVPIFLLMDLLRQRFRLLRGASQTQDIFTEQGHRIVLELRRWNWNGILANVCFLGILFVVLLLGGKCTFVFLSRLNGVLKSLATEMVFALVFIISVLMFMLPPVPGSAVYIFAGIVLGNKATESMSIWLATLVVSLVGMAGKVSGCLGQYSIGYLLGKDVRVQKLVGVDTVPTRAIEKILKTSGLGLGKVAILVGGPDWPTSVTCGILKMNILQMLLGTLPVYLVSVLPQTFVGALLVFDRQEDPEFWNGVSTFCNGFAAAAQAAASLIAAYKITATVEKDQEELSQPREEHAKVAELTKKREEFSLALQAVSDWTGPHMTKRRKATIIVAAAVMSCSGAVFALDFVLAEPICFRKFDITSDINAPFQDGGLGGNVLDIVIQPQGMCNLFLTVAAALLFQSHRFGLSRLARELVGRAKE